MSEGISGPWKDEKLAIDVWKYYGGIGGADKDQMIKIVTWLLTLSTGIISLYATGRIKSGTATTLLLVVGVLVSSLGAFTALLYGGYAAWNWAIADRIAIANRWTVQCPDFRPIPMSEIRWWDRIPLCLAEPCQNKVAPVFWIFFLASLTSIIVHAVLLIKLVVCG